MAKENNKLKKYVAFTAVIGTVIAAIAAFVAKLHFNKKKSILITGSDKKTEADDLNKIDFNSIDNDTPRDYISIQINNNK